MPTNQKSSLTPAQARMLGEIRQQCAKSGYAVPQANRNGERVARCLCSLGYVREIKNPNGFACFTVELVEEAPVSSPSAPSEEITLEFLNGLVNHDDFQGFGYLAHDRRSTLSDETLVAVANAAGASRADVAALVLSRAGRHLLDEAEGTAIDRWEWLFTAYLMDRRMKNSPGYYGLAGYSSELEGTV